MFESLKNHMFRQSIMEANANKKEELGTLRILDDGRKFRYAKNGGVALVAGTCLMNPGVVAHHSNMAVVADVPAGKNKLTVTLGATAVTANQYAGGFVQINAGAGNGYQFKVLSHPAHAGTGNLEVIVSEPIAKALASATSKASLVRSPYDALVVTDGAAKPVVGVAPCDVPIGFYFWVQTGGLAQVKVKGTPAAYSNAFPVDGGRMDAGPVTITTQVLAAGPIAGYFLALGVNDNWKPVFLTID